MMEFKTLDGPIIDLSERVVTVAISEVESKDLDNEIISTDAYTKTVTERGPNGVKLIYHLGDHIPSTKSVIGKPMEIGMRVNKLFFRTDIEKTNYGNDMLAMYKSGTINQHSVGFSVIRDEKPKKDGDPRILKELKLYEGSAVLWGANPNTPTLSVGKSLTKEEKEKEVDFMLKEMGFLKKAIKTGITDEMAELLEIRLEIYETRLKHIFAELAKTTQAVSIETPAPVNDSRLFADRLHLLTLQF